MSNNLVTFFAQPTGIAVYRRGRSSPEIYLSYTVNNVSDWEHHEPSFTFVHNLLRFHIEYFSETGINDVLKGQNIGLIIVGHTSIAYYSTGRHLVLTRWTTASGIQLSQLFRTMH